MADIDRSHMHLALREAKKGIGRTSPNPCVGAVVVKNNKVVARAIINGPEHPMQKFMPSEKLAKRQKTPPSM